MRCWMQRRGLAVKHSLQVLDEALRAQQLALRHAPFTQTRQTGHERALHLLLQRIPVDRGRGGGHTVAAAMSRRDRARR